MDIIYLSGLRVEAIIGINEWEQRIRQTVNIDLEMAADVSKAAASDAIEDTLNYKKVAKRVSGFVEDSRFKLVETLAERIADLLLNEFKIPWVKVVLNKPGAVRGSQGVGVMIERRSQG